MNEDFNGHVVITPREIYDEVKGVRADVQKLVQVIESQADDIKDQREDLKDHEDRIRGLEASKWKLPSIAAAVSAVLSGGGATALQQILTKGA